MAYQVVDCDNIRESFTSSGTTVTLGGAVPFSRPFSAKLSTGATFYGTARKGAEYSTGLFTYTSGSPGSIAQTTVWVSSNGNAAVSFSSGGTGEVFIDPPARLFDELNLNEITIASAATCDIGAAEGARVLISGTATITSFGTSANKRRFVRFSGALLLTHNATSLILPGGNNITTAAGDTAVFLSDSSGNWRCHSYQGLASYGILGNNRLVNPSGQINQIGTGTAADGTYWFDNWYHLNEANPVTPSQLLNAENGTPFMIRTTQSNASAQRFGIVQAIENADSMDLRGAAVSLSARVRMSVSTTLRFVIIDWSGSVDTITRDFVNNWSSATFTAGNFFTSTGTNIIATGSIALTANTFANIALSGTMTGSTNNAVAMFWTDSQQAQNVTLDIAKVQFEAASVPTAFARRSPIGELLLCQRQLYVIAPGTTGADTATGGTANTGTVGYFPILFPVRMLFSPTMSLSAASDWTNNPFVSGATQQTGSSVVFAATSPFGTRVQLTTPNTGAGSTGGMSTLETANTSAKIIAKAQL